MTGPAITPDPDPLAQLKAMRGAQAPTDPLEQLKAMKPAPAHDIHAEYASGNLAKRMARENQNDADAADVPDPVSKTAAFGQSLAATGANIAQGIPGMEAVQAGVRSVARGQPYRESLADIRGATGNIPTPLRVGEKIAGSLPLAAMLPGNPATAGAIVGGADEALNADPDMGTGERVARTAIGAGVGAVAGKTLDKAITMGRAALPASVGGTENAASKLLQMKADRAASARAMYGTALDDAQGKAPTQAVIDYVNEPEIADRIGKLRALEPLKNLEPTSPQMLDALYKSFSDEAKAVKKGAGALDPTKINLGRFRGQDIAGKQQRLLDALETPGTQTTTVPAMTTAQSPNPSLRDALQNFRDRATAAYTRTQGTTEQQMARRALERRGAEDVAVSPPLRGAPSEQTITSQTPPVMPSYRQAVQDFANHSQNIDAFEKGYDAVRAGQSSSLPSAKNLTRKTPQAFAEWVRTASPDQIIAARQGIMGATKDAVALPGKTFAPGRKAAGTAANLLRLAPTKSQTLLEAGQNLGLLTAGNQAP